MKSTDGGFPWVQARHGSLCRKVANASESWSLKQV
jgi:hypothetical protein